MIVYFRQEKARIERERIAEQAKGVGRPKVGGPFELIDQEGKTFTDGDMKGGFSIVSLFFFELLKMTPWGHHGVQMMADGMTDKSDCPGILWLHTLPRYLSRRTRQIIKDN